MRHMSFVWALVAMLLGASQAHGMWADVPLAKLVVDSDLVITCEVTNVGPVGKEKFQPPGRPRAISLTVRTAEVAVLDVMRDKNKVLATPKGAKAGAAVRKIKLIYQAREPVAPGQMRPIVANGYPPVEVGGKYLVIVSKIKGKKAYYLPSYPKNLVRLTARKNERADQIRKVADIAAWPWGKVSGGLQMAIVIERPEVYLATVRRGRGGPPKQLAYVQFAAAVRNASKKPIVVNTYPPDRLLTLTFSQQGGPPRVQDLYSFLARAYLRAFGTWATTVLKPGEVALVTPHGLGQSHGQQLDVHDGKVTLNMTYESTRDAASENGLKLWKGKVSAAASVKVIKRKDRPHVPQPVRKLPMPLQAERAE